MWGVFPYLFCTYDGYDCISVYKLYVYVYDLILGDWGWGGYWILV